MVRICSAACRAHGAPLTVGVGTNDTAAAITSLRELAATGDVAAALVPAPPYIRPGEAGTLAHFTALAEDGGLPLIVYDIPYRTGQTLSADTIAALGRLPGIVGIKHATGAIDATTMELLGSPPPASPCSAATTSSSHRSSRRAPTAELSPRPISAPPTTPN